jgi:2-amino-4-hydroxy-6-hydroxymethyldihydropteridine diphosphokinase
LGRWLEKFFPRAGLNNAVRVAVALGSNLGDRAHHLDFARERLAALLSDFRMSRLIETAPVGVPDTQPHFLNAAVVGDTALSALDFFYALQEIERAAGRVRPFPGAARSLDLDLILFGTKIIAGQPLTVPHPRFRERRFVLEPLAEIAPDLRDPITSLTIAELLAQLPPAR